MKYIASFLLVLFCQSTSLRAQQRPVMGWSSWNHFRIHIDEQMIREQADALISTGMYAAGYRYINIDDGYFAGRDSAGNLLTDAKKFPSGMGALAGYIHSRQLRAGIYTDAGRNTCGSIYDKDSNGVGAGIYGYMEKDLDLFFRRWKFDFLKVDWCGGEKMKLDEQTEYLKLLRQVKGIDRNIVFNICRWKFPGSWAIREADSWRISGDIRPEFSSILKIIDLNAGLYKYASPGHYNDMDMLQVGRGMSTEEDKTHFSMWCLLNSPLLAGNDLRKMSSETLAILCNRELIAINQDTGFVQGRRLYREGDVEVWEKILGDGSQKALALLNRGEQTAMIKLTAAKTGIGTRSRLRDLWLRRELGLMGKERSFQIPRHGIIVLKITETGNADIPYAPEKVLTLLKEHTGPVVDQSHPDVVASANRSGFETGQVVKLDSVYHLFVNEMFDRPHRDLRIAHWTSPDASNWKRQATLVQSIPGRSPDNLLSEVWVSTVLFNEEENAWNMIYVAYRAGDSTKGEIHANDYAGRIWRAVAVKKGKEGIGGPYAPADVLLEPDKDSQVWEGQQSVASFFPYKAGTTWYALYDGHYHTPKGPWPTGLAFAKNLKGPWTRLPEGFNPLKIVDVFMENAVVTRLRDGRYLMVFDSFGDQEIGYSLSADGISWCPEIRVKIQSAAGTWAAPGDHSMRTPLGAVEEPDGTFTVVYTALRKTDKGNFYALGKCTLAWAEATGD